MTTAAPSAPKKTKTVSKKSTHSESKSAVKNNEDMNGYIAAAAYFKAESRGFEPGHDLEDWLEAEIELMSSMKKH